MAKREDIQHSVLIVSSSDKFDALVRRSLSPRDYASVESKKNSGLARRCILERYYDLVIINVPLQDERGEDLALDVTENCNASVLLVVPQEIYGDLLEAVTDYGILIIPKPVPRGEIDKAIRFLTATQNKIHSLERKLQASQEKMEELRLVNKAKILLIERKHLTEDDAHRLIGKQAMDHGLSRGSIARRIIEDLE